MPSTPNDIGEEHFLQGLSSARAGLAEETCPYHYVTDNASTDVNQISAPVNWRQGWQLGRFVAIQRARKEKEQELQSALGKLFSYEAAHCDQCEVLNLGFAKSGLKYLLARKESTKLAEQIKQSKEFRLLRDLYIELYVPCRPNEHPYTFKIYDQLLGVFGNAANKERTLRQLVERYGERHGVQAAWHEYVQAESTEMLAPGRRE